MWKKIKRTLITIKNFLLNPRLVLCVGISWIITNGWAYIFMFLGAHLNISWMMKVAGVYIAILYSPLCVEGILTIAISIFLLKILFPNDIYTLKLLRVYSRKYKLVFQKKLRKIKSSRNKRKQRRT